MLFIWREWGNSRKTSERIANAKALNFSLKTHKKTCEHNRTLAHHNTITKKNCTSFTNYDFYDVNRWINPAPRRKYFYAIVTITKFILIWKLYFPHMEFEISAILMTSHGFDCQFYTIISLQNLTCFYLIYPFCSSVLIYFYLLIIANMWL